MKTLKLCEYCGTPFQPKRATKRFCKNECRLAAWGATHARIFQPILRACVECTRPFFPRTPGAAFCSDLCRTRRWIKDHPCKVASTPKAPQERTEQGIQSIKTLRTGDGSPLLPANLQPTANNLQPMQPA